jgi:hypothetical protein
MVAKYARPRSLSLKLAQNLRIISVSYHEAAHTIAALLHFMIVPEVAVVESKRHVSGYTHYEVFTFDTNLDEVDKKIKDYIVLSEICLKYAGLMGESIHFEDLSGSKILPVILKIGNEPDIQDAANLIKKYSLVEPGEKRYLFKKKLFRKITALLKEYWSDVKLLAHALYDRRKLQYEDLRYLLTKKSENKKFWQQQFKDIDTLFKEHNLINYNHIANLFG